MKRYDKIVLLALLLVFAVGGYRSISSALTPYVTFAYADESARSVQVKGNAVDGTIALNQEEGSFTFSMRDAEGGTARVYHKGPLPQNLLDADSVVVVGRFVEGTFIAQRILVKCPSKYEAK